jgi:hypothetical protein
VESAKGCYSAAILKRKDVRVKYAIKAFTDIDANDSVNTHGLYLGIGSKRDRSIIYKAGSPQDGKALLQLSPTWFEVLRMPLDHHDVTIASCLTTCTKAFYITLQPMKE